MVKNKNNILNFIVTGSNGWISQNFISYIKTNLPEANIFEINRENGLSSIKEYSNLENVFLIHNVFTRAEYLIKNISKNEFLKKSEEQFKIIEKFLTNSNTIGCYYPSSGSIYKLREKDKTVYKPYSDQKLFEEKSYSEVCEKNNIKLIIPRIFSSVGPYMNNPTKFPLSSFILESLNDGKVTIQSKSNNVYSFCFLSTLSELVINYLIKDNIKDNKIILDPVDYNFSLLEIAESVAELNLNDRLKVSYQFDNSNIEKYVGDSTNYENLKNQLSIKTLNFKDQLIVVNEYLKKYYI